MKHSFTIQKGSRHCKILDADGEVVFRTTNLRDAEQYLALHDEKDRLLRLLESRGIAPHRIYLLANDEAKRGSANLEETPASEVVIVAKADDAVVVRHLGTGKEEIVDLDEIEPIDGGSYLQAAETDSGEVNLVIRVDVEDESASIAACSEASQADSIIGSWKALENDDPGSEYAAKLAHESNGVLIFRAEALIEQ